MSRKQEVDRLIRELKFTPIYEHEGGKMTKGKRTVGLRLQCKETGIKISLLGTSNLHLKITLKKLYTYHLKLLMG